MHRLLLAPLFVVLCASIVSAADDIPIDFAHDIAPIVREKCVRCHGVGTKKGGLSFDTRASWLKGGDSGAAVLVGDAAKSLIIERITTDDESLRMPLEDDPLSPKEIALLTRWIDGGLAWESGFSFSKSFRVSPLPPRDPSPPGGGSMNLVDRWLNAYWAERGIDVPLVVSDRVFARRVSLDLVGLLPSPEELEEFVSDADPHKRTKLVRRLLADREAYADHWLSFWNDALRNDYFGPGYIDNGRSQITRWLYQSLYENKPYDQFVTDLVTAAPGAEGFTKGIIWRGVVNASQRPEMQAAQNIGQVFLGTNLKCASCHDSFVNQWTLADAYAMAAVFAEGPLEIHHCDKPTGEVSEVGFLFPELGEIDAAAKPARMQQLASLLVHPGNGRVPRTMVNRLWAKLFGRGIVEPVDNLDAEPWHQDLLDSLASEFVKDNYDTKALLELICTSRAYQLPAVSSTNDDEFVFRGPEIKRMTAEQFVDAVSTLTGRWQAISLVMFKPDGRNQGGQLTAVAMAKGSSSPMLPGEGEWIWSHSSAGQADDGGRIYLRKDVEFEEVPTRMAAVLTADNECVIYVNNQQVGASENWGAPLTVELTPFLVPGTNRIAVEAANWPDTSKGKGLEHAAPNPAGFRFFAAAWRDGTVTQTIASDASWRVSTQELPDWRTSEPTGEHWTDAVPLEGALPWNLGENFSLIADPALTFRVRAALVPNNPLLHALGRPGREQVVTQRESLATTLEALELTNGEILYDRLRTGADRWFTLAEQAGADDKSRWLIDRLYMTALGRKPTAEELAVASELIGDPVEQERIEDLLWMLVMLPEFQLVR